jgi:ParB family chromosome partitioning protein
MTQGRSALGRGLDSLIQVEEAPNTLPIDKLRPNRWQPRTEFDDEGLAELAESIRVQGIVQPLIVTTRDREIYTIVAGERRWRAARRAGLDEVPVVVREVTGDRELLELALVENLQRADLNAIEEAEAYRSLQESFGLGQEEIGRRVGRSRVAITNTLRLLNLPDEVQDLLRSGRLSAGQARPLLGLASEEEQVRLATQAAESSLSARQLEELVRPPEKKAASAGRAEKRRDPNDVAAAESLTRSLQTRVEIARRGSGGTVRLHFHSEEELMRLYDLLVAGVTTEKARERPADGD